MRLTVLSCSLAPVSRSRGLARLACERIEAAGHDAVLIDLRDRIPPPFDNDRAFDASVAPALHAAIAGADGVVIASPVYNWGLAAAAKSLIELTGATGEGGRESAWFDTLVTFVCAGGLPHAYMAHLPVATALMLDFKCVLNPYHVYASERDWTDPDTPGPALRARLDRTVAVKLELAERLRGRSYRSGWEI